MGDWASLKLWATEDLASSWEVDSEQGKEWLRMDSVLKPANKMYFSDIAEFWSTDIHNNIYTHFTLVRNIEIFIVRNIEIFIYLCIQCTYMHQHKSRYIVVLVCSAGKRKHRRMNWGEIGHKNCTQGLHDLFYFTRFMCQWNEVIYQLLPTLIWFW